jgi:Rrf2 family cysteine metabolism transcriptional repressor
LSTRGRYGVRAMSRLASRYRNNPVPIRTLAQEERIPIRYLEQIMTRLRREGLLQSARGPGGGYKLNRPPDQISLGEIIEILEGNVSVASCTEDDPKSQCPLVKTCVPRIFWSKLSTTIQSILNSISLQEFNENNWNDTDLGSLLKRRGLE